MKTVLKWTLTMLMFFFEVTLIGLALFIAYHLYLTVFHALVRY